MKYTSWGEEAHLNLQQVCEMKIFFMVIIRVFRMITDPRHLSFIGGITVYFDAYKVVFL